MKLALIIFLFIAWQASAECAHPDDTYDRYDPKPKSGEILNKAADFLVLSFSHAPSHCQNVSQASKQPGGKDFLQCGSGLKFSYILHGLWPQSIHGDHPRYCSGDRPNLPRDTLDDFLCMTPSFSLMQHEYEKHGTCMPNVTERDAERYFHAAFTIVNNLVLPNSKTTNESNDIEWIIANNKYYKLTKNSFYFKSNEWRFCFSNDYEVISCPRK